MKNNKYLFAVFLSALIVRLLFLWITNPKPELWITPENQMYISIADGIIDMGEFVHKHGPPLKYIQETERLPGYPLYLVLYFVVFGSSLIWPLIGQIILGSVTCVVIGLIVEEFHENTFIIGGMLAAFNLNLINHDTLILADSLLMFFFTIHLYHTIQLLKNPNYGRAGFSGFFLGLAVMTKPVVIYWVPIIAIFISIIFIVRLKRFVPAVIYGAMILIGPSLLTSPHYLRNYSIYGSWELVSQTGTHLMNWVVPLTKEYNTGKPWSESVAEINITLKEEVQRQGLEKLPENPFHASKLMQEVALIELKSMGLWAITYAWTVGSFINLMTPSTASLGFIDRMERPRFYKTKGSNILIKIINFLFHPDNRIYLIFLLPSFFLLLLIRLFFMIGLINLFNNASKLHLTILALLLSGYIFAVTGPVVGGARFRLPIEPVLITVTTVGLINSYCYWKTRQQSNDL